MNKPTWVKVVGVLTIIFGILGLMGSMQEILLPLVLQFQQEIVGAAIENGQMSSHDIRMLARVYEIFNVPEWYTVWSVIGGIISLLVCGFYLFSGIWFITVKPRADRLLLWALSLSILLGLVKMAAAIAAFSGITIFIAVTVFIGIIIDFILLIAVMANDRSVFRPAQ